MINTAGMGIGETSEGEAAVPVPKDEGEYTAKVLFGTAEQTRYYSDPSNDYGSTLTNPTLQVYGTPKFTSFLIPNAGTGKEDHAITAYVTGVNFKAPGITAESFRVSCAGKPSITAETTVKILSDRGLAVTLTIPGQAGAYEVTIANGANTVNGTFTVKDYGDYSSYTAGRIVLKDGTFVSKDEYTAIAANNPPVAVMVGAQNVYGVPLGIGLHTQGKRWAKDGSTGFHTKFEGIICTSSETGSGAAGKATFTGDKDGIDNWEYICGQDALGAANAEENYPAFHWVNEYATVYNTGTNVKWYMPSLIKTCFLKAMADIRCQYKIVFITYQFAQVFVYRFWCIGIAVYHNVATPVCPTFLQCRVRIKSAGIHIRKTVLCVEIRKVLFEAFP